MHHLQEDHGRMQLRYYMFDKWMFVMMMDVSAIGSYPPEAPVIKASLPLISLSTTMFRKDLE